MKKNIIILVISLNLITVSLDIKAQCCPYINSVRIQPENPIEGEEIKVITNITTPSLGKEISTSFYWQNDTVFITGCWWNGIFTSPKGFMNSFNIGKLNSGNFVIHFTAFEDSGVDSCGAGRFQIRVMNFTVGIIGTQINHYKTSYTLYPNPFRSEFFLTTTNIDNIKILDHCGRILESIEVNGEEKTVLNPSNLKCGSYYIHLSKENTIIYRERLIKL